MEVWFRMNYFTNVTKGTLQTLIMKSAAIDSLSADFGIQLTESFIRIHFMNQFQDIPAPTNLSNYSSKNWQYIR